MSLSRIGPAYWRARLRKWSPPKRSTPGYSLLVPVPGDLPVMLRLALAVLRHQESQARLDTIVLPDRMTSEIAALVSEARPTWAGELRLRPFPPPERWILPRLGDPGRNHAFQLITGVAASNASHIILHDADLFLLEPGQLDRHYEMCRQGGFSCFGVSPAWDEWYEGHGLRLAATWELCARTEWVRSFPPVEHMAHEHEMFGEKRVFDTTYHPQAQTEPSRIGVAPSENIVHFNYVISNYRRFLRRGADDWLDANFRLLLLVLFVEVFDTARAAGYSLPRLEEMVEALNGPPGPIRFPAQEKGGSRYHDFRRLLGLALSGPWVAPAEQARVTESLSTFDRFYDYPAAPDAGQTALDVAEAAPGPAGAASS